MKTRQELLQDFIGLDSLTPLLSFLEDCKNDERFICLEHGKVNNLCIDAIARIVNVGCEAASKGEYEWKIPNVLYKTKLYNIEALKFVILKNVKDNNVKGLNLLKGTGAFVFVYREHSNVIDIQNYEGMPDWAHEFNNLQYNRKTLIQYAFNLGNVETVLLFLEWYQGIGGKEPRIYSRGENDDSLGHAIRLLLVRKYGCPSDKIIPMRGNGKIDYDFPLYMELLRELSLYPSEQCRAMAHAYLKGELHKDQLVFLLNDPKLTQYSSISAIVYRISASVLENLMSLRPNFYDFAQTDICYANIDYVTDKEWVPRVLSKLHRTNSPKFKAYQNLRVNDITLDIIKDVVSVDWKLARGILKSVEYLSSNGNVFEILRNFGVCKPKMNQLLAVIHQRNIKLDELISSLASINSIRQRSLEVDLMKSLSIEEKNKIIPILSDAKEGTGSYDLYAILFKKTECFCKNDMYGIEPFYIESSEDPLIIEAGIEREIKILECGHYFHSTCVATWIQSQLNRKQEPSCPICREKIDPINLISFYYFHLFFRHG